MKLPTDFLIISFFFRAACYRIRFKVIQRPLSSKVKIYFYGEPFYTEKSHRKNRIYVNTSVSKQDFERKINEAIRQRYDLPSYCKISLKFEKGNKIKFKDV